MGSVTIIVILPLFIILILGSSLIGEITGGDRTQVVMPYEPEKGIVWECDIQDGTPIELVETEIDGEKQIFHFKSNSAMDMVSGFAELAKGLITKEYSEYEHSYGEYYRVVFTDENDNEQKYYAESEVDTESIYFDKAVFYAPDEYFAFDYTVTAQQPIEGEYGWYNQDSEYRTEFYKADYSPTRTVTIVHAGDDYFESDEEYYNYWIEYGPIDNYNRETESVKMKYRIVDGEVEIFEEKHTLTEYDKTTSQTETGDSSNE